MPMTVQAERMNGACAMSQPGFLPTNRRASLQLPVPSVRRIPREKGSDAVALVWIASRRNHHPHPVRELAGDSDRELPSDVFVQSFVLERQSFPSLSVTPPNVERFVSTSEVRAGHGEKDSVKERIAVIRPRQADPGLDAFVEKKSMELVLRPLACVGGIGRRPHMRSTASKVALRGRENEPNGPSVEEVGEFGNQQLRVSHVLDHVAADDHRSFGPLDGQTARNIEIVLEPLTEVERPPADFYVRAEVNANEIEAVPVRHEFLAAATSYVDQAVGSQQVSKKRRLVVNVRLPQCVAGFVRPIFGLQPFPISFLKPVWHGFRCYSVREL